MDGYFDIELRYGGYVKDGNYHGGFATTVKNFEAEYTSYFELLDIMLEEAPDFKNRKIADVLYCAPNEDFNDGFKLLMDDKDAIDLASIGLKHGSVAVYMVFEDCDNAEVLNDALRIEYISSDPSTPMKKSKRQKTTALKSPIATWAERRRAKMQKLRIDEERAVKRAEEEAARKRQRDVGKGKAKMFEGTDMVSDAEDSSEEEVSDDGVCFDTSSDEELVEARRKIKEDAVKDQDPYMEWMHEEESLSNSEDQSDSEDFIESNESDEGPIKEKTIKKMIVDHDLKNAKWSVGMRFADPKLFKEIITRYAIMSGYPIVWRKSDSRRKEAHCNDDDCEWRIYASWNGNKDAFVVKVVNDEHKCVREDYKNYQCKPSFLAREYLSKFKADPDLKKKTLAEEVNTRFGIHLKKSTFYRTQKRAKEILYGTLEKHFLKVIPYIEELKRVEPDATIELVTDPPSEDGKPQVFKRLYISFPATRNGFLEGCRPFLCLDATFLKSPVGGVLLAAVGRDGNNQMFPVAWAVAEAETNDTWAWFAQILRKDLPGFCSRGSTIISDQHLGLTKAVKDWFSEVEHRNCARHIYANWMKGLRGGSQLKSAFWKAVRSYERSDYDQALKEMKEVNPEGHKKFLLENPAKFCRSKVQTDAKCEVIVNNLVESFNGSILEARKKPVVDMLEEIREVAMMRLAMKKETIEASDMRICPRIMKNLVVEKEKARGCEVARASKTLFQVTQSLSKYAVDMESRSCTCKKFDLTGIPCIHAIAVCNWMRTPPEGYIASWYMREKYLATWSGVISPINGPQEWKASTVRLAPPAFRVAPGRPRRCRRKKPQERNDKKGTLTRHGMRMTCTNCGEKDHNKRGCKKEPTSREDTNQPQAKRRGRPRKVVNEEEPVAAHRLPRGRPRKGTTKYIQGTVVPTGRGIYQEGDTIYVNPGQEGERVIHRDHVPEGPTIVDTGSQAPPSTQQ